jgi:hypothetical protein
MMDDPLESNYVRDLLQAGATDGVSDYDYEKGLVKHLGLVAGGALPPSWAESSGTAAKAGATSSIKMAALWLGLPIVSAGVVAAVLWTGNDLPWSASEKPSAVPAEYVGIEPSGGEPKESAVGQEKTTAGVGLQATQGLKANVEPRRRTPAQSYFARHRTAANRPVVGASSTGMTKNRAEAGRSPRANALSAAITPNPYTQPTVTQAGTGFAKGEKLPDYDGTRNAATPSRRVAVPQAQEIETPRAVEAAEIKGEKAETGKVSIAIEPFAQVEQKRSEIKKTDPLEKEMRMLAMANRFLQSDPQRALELTELGEREFPKGKGVFAEERRYIRVLSLIKLGRADEARNLGMKYLSRYPKGPFSERVRRALATGVVPEE